MKDFRLRLILLVTVAAVGSSGCRTSVMRTGGRRHDRDSYLLELSVTDWDARPLRGQWSAPADLMDRIGGAKPYQRIEVQLQTGPGRWERWSTAPVAAWRTTEQGFQLSAATGTADFILAPSETGMLLGKFTLEPADLAGRYEGITGEPDGHTLLSLTLRGVDAAYLDALADPAAPLTWAQVERLYRHGVSPEYVRAIRKARSTPATRPAAAVEAEPLPEPGPLPQFTIDDIVYLSTRGVTAEYVQALQAGGYRLDAEQLYYLRVRGVTPDYAVAWRDAGYALSTKELYYAKVRGIDAAYAKGMREAGQDLSLERLYYMEVRGLTPRYARGFRDLGYDLTPEKLYYLKVRGITPDYAAAMNDPDHELLTPEQLYHLKIHGVDPELVRALRGQGTDGKAE